MHMVSQYDWNIPGGAGKQFASRLVWEARQPRAVNGKGWLQLHESVAAPSGCALSAKIADLHPCVQLTGIPPRSSLQLSSNAAYELAQVVSALQRAIAVVQSGSLIGAGDTTGFLVGI